MSGEALLSSNEFNCALQVFFLLDFKSITFTLIIFKQQANVMLLLPYVTCNNFHIMIWQMLCFTLLYKLIKISQQV